MKSKKNLKERNPQGFIILIMFNASLHLLHSVQPGAQLTFLTFRHDFQKIIKYSPLIAFNSEPDTPTTVEFSNLHKKPPKEAKPSDRCQLP